MIAGTNSCFAQNKSKTKSKLITAKTFNSPSANVKYGIASYYATNFQDKKTSNGDIYVEEAMTAACNVLPMNSWIKVTNLKNNKSVIVRINDRLHPKNKRIVDLSKAAAEVLGYISAGITKVKVEVLKDFEINSLSF